MTSRDQGLFSQRQGRQRRETLGTRLKSLCRREMPHHFNYYVLGCINSLTSKPHLQYYRIPRTEKLRKTYQVLLRNETLKLHSCQTRVCSEHFEGGQKLSRQHLPSLFPWTKRAEQRRQIIKHEMSQRGKKRKKNSTCQFQQYLRTTVLVRCRMI